MQQEAEVALNESSIATWQQQLDDTIIRAPFSGIVTSKNAQSRATEYAARSTETADEDMQILFAKISDCWRLLAVNEGLWEDFAAPGRHD